MTPIALVITELTQHQRPQKSRIFKADTRVAALLLEAHAMNGEDLTWLVRRTSIEKNVVGDSDVFNLAVLSV